MQNKPISDLVAAFDQQSDRVRACLTDLLGTVGEGRVPSREAMSGLDSSVAELRTRYDAVYAMTRDTVSAGELPRTARRWESLPTPWKTAAPGIWTGS